MFNHHSYKRCQERIVPESYFKSFCSSRAHSSQASWVTCQFSPDISNEHLLLVGDQDGQFFVVDVRYASGNSFEKLIKKTIRADKSCILELEFIPKKPFLVVSLSGHSNVCLWDFEKSTRVYAFKGHEGSVKALAVSPFNPDIFVTGSRDGMICEWDQRVAPNSLGFRFPNSTIIDAHSTSSISHGIYGRQKQRGTCKTLHTQVGITSLIYLDENTIVSSSTSFKTDIRLWDMRYRSKNRPIRVLEVPKTRNARDFGIASLCLDRFRASLFAACTDSSIYEYAITSSRKQPIAALSGVPKLEFNAFDVRLASSPISDHLLFGSGDDHGLIWDFHERRRNLVDNEPTEYYPYPKFVLGGHQTEVRVVRISSSGQYIVSMDDTHWRLWKASLTESNFLSSLAGYERIEYFQLPETAIDSYKMTQLSVDSSNSTPSARKRKMVSPFVSPTKHLNASEKFSPASKVFKQLSSPLSSITNILNEHVCSIARRKLEFSNGTSKVEKANEMSTVENFFHMKFPTMNLPDFVKERELSKIKAKYPSTSSSAKSKKRMLKGTMEDYIALGKPISNCSRMVKALERKINLSPRKLVLKRRLQESAKIAAERYTPKTPHREKHIEKVFDADELDPNNVRKILLRNKKLSGSIRTLEDYFNKPT